MIYIISYSSFTYAGGIFPAINRLDKAKNRGIGELDGWQAAAFVLVKRESDYCSMFEQVY